MAFGRRDLLQLPLRASLDRRRRFGLGEANRLSISPELVELVSARLCLVHDPQWRGRFRAWLCARLWIDPVPSAGGLLVAEPKAKISPARPIAEVLTA